MLDGGDGQEANNGGKEEKAATIISNINDINEFSTLTHAKAKEVLQVIEKIFNLQFLSRKR